MPDGERVGHAPFSTFLGKPVTVQAEPDEGRREAASLAPDVLTTCVDREDAAQNTGHVHARRARDGQLIGIACGQGRVAQDVRPEVEETVLVKNKYKLQQLDSSMSVCLIDGLPSVTVSMEGDSINWAQGRGLSKKSYFPDPASKPGSRHTIGCHAANFALGP